MKSRISWLTGLSLLILFVPFISVATTKNGDADLAIGKAASAYSVKVGDQFFFHLSVTNLGPDSATNVIVGDVLPSGCAYVSSGGAGTYYPGYGLWILSAGPAGAVSFLTITVQATAVGMLTNTAFIFGSNINDTNTANDMASAVVAVASAGPTADLQITKTASTNNVKVGEQVVFKLDLENLGPDYVTNDIVVTDCLPPSFQYITDNTVGGSGLNGVYSPGTCLWTLTGGLGTNFILHLQITALATAAGIFTNFAVITVPAGVTDPNTNNNAASAIVAVTQPAADLQVTKTVSTNSSKVFQGFNFYVAVTNVGAVTVSNAVITDLFPTGVSLVYWVGYGGINQNYTPSNGVWTVTNIPPGQGYLLSLGAAGLTPGSFTNVAQLTSSVPADTNAANNMASAAITILPLQADLAVTKTVFTNTLPVFSTFAFNFFLTVTNLGPDTVSNLTLTDILPAGLTFGAAINNPGSTYTASNGLWSFSIPLAAGQGATMSLVTGPPLIPGTFTNTLKVNVPSTVTDPNTNNNSASVIVKVLPVYRILGYVANCSSNGVPLANVTVTLSGAANQTTTTFGIGNGNFSFDNVSNGVYTVTPSQPGNVFTPASAVVTVSNAWVTVPPFVGNVGLIYGQVSYFGSPVTNHPVTLAGGGLPRPRLVLTDATGYYIFTNTPAGNYTVTAVATNGYRFNPTNAAIKLDATNCAAFTNFVAVSRRGVQLVALEVVQVIQDWSNSVRLIQSKETYVRAHLQLTNNNPVLLQGARLYGGAGGPLSPLPPGSLFVRWMNAADRPIRENLTNSFMFRLPNAWLSGTMNFRFECTNNVTVTPTNVVPPNSTVQVTFVPAPPLPVKIVPINWTNAAGVYQQISANNLADVPRRLLSMYPVPSVDAEPAPPLIVTNRHPNAPAQQGPPYPIVNSRLATLQFLDRLAGFNFRGGLPPLSPRIYHGAVAGAVTGTAGATDGWGRDDSGLAISVPSSISSGLMPPNADFYNQLFLRHLATHEVGHNLGRPHTVSQALFSTNAAGEVLGSNGETADPGTPAFPLYQRVPPPGGPIRPALGPMTSGTNSLIYGLDTLTFRTAPAINALASPYVYFDVMSYHGVHPLSWWISTANYNAIFGYVTNTFRPIPPPLAPAPPPSGTNDWLIIRGLVNFTLTNAEFLPFLTVSSMNTPPSPPPGTFHLLLYDGVGGILQDIPFEPTHDESENGEDKTGSFIVPVLADPAIRRIILWDGTSFLADLIGSSNAPVVTSVILSSTNGGSFTGSGLLNINWSASDSDPDTSLTYTIQYSPNNGETWETITTDWSDQNYSLDSESLPASTNGLIRVTASDGFNSSAPAQSSPFTILPHPPMVSINSPMDGTFFIADEQIFLDASVLDLQDGSLDGTNVQWTSSLDGVLGGGAILNFEAGTLSEGTHDVTVTATDSLGLTNSASVRIYVLREPPPQLDIQLIGSAVEITWPSSVTNYVLESTLKLAPAAWNAVTNVPAAADAQQTVTVDVSNSNRFFRLRMTP